MTAVRSFHVVGQLEHGGITTWLRALVEGAVREELAVDICCNFRGGVGPLREVFETLGCRVMHVPMGANLWSYRKRLGAVLRDGHYDVVHDHRSFLGGATLRAAARAGVPVRVLYHHTPDDDRTGGLHRRVLEKLLRRWALTHATHIWGSSAPTMAALYGDNWRAGDARRAVVQGGAVVAEPGPGARERVRAELGIPVYATVVAYVGRVTLPKNPVGAARVGCRLVDSDAATWFVMVGDGPVMDAVREVVRACDHADRCVLAGFRDDIAGILAAVDVLVQPSRFEGFPLTVVEAMYAGVPVVASRAAGLMAALPETLRERACDADDIDGFTHAVRDVLADLGVRGELREHARGYLPAEAARRVVTAYREALG